MAFLAPVVRPAAARPSRHLLLAGLAVLVAAVVLALMPRHEAPAGTASAVVPSVAAPRADPPLRAPAEPVRPAPAARKAALAPPPARRSAPAEADEVSPVRSASIDDLSEDAAAAGMTSRAETADPAQR